MFFFTLNIANFNFLKREIWWKFYIIGKAPSAIKQLELVVKKEFVAITFDLGYKTFVIHVAFLESPSNDQKGDIYLFCRAYIAALVAYKTSTSIFTEYFDFADIFSPKLTL